MYDCYESIIDVEPEVGKKFRFQGKSGLSAGEVANAIYEYLKDYDYREVVYDMPKGPYAEVMAKNFEAMKSRLFKELLDSSPYAKLIDP